MRDNWIVIAIAVALIAALALVIWLMPRGLFSIVSSCTVARHPGRTGGMMHLRLIVAATAVLVPGLAALLPAMGQAPDHSYLVFFEWDKYALSDMARQTIHEVALKSTQVQYTRIEANGYTDTSGTPQYNMGLSLRRAQAVQAQLIKDGVPKDVITIQAFGETRLLVPTGPGVREPRNRRVEIIIRVN